MQQIRVQHWIISSAYVNETIYFIISYYVLYSSGQQKFYKTNKND